MPLQLAMLKLKTIILAVSAQEEQQQLVILIMEYIQPVQVVILQFRQTLSEVQPSPTPLVLVMAQQPHRSVQCVVFIMQHRVSSL